MGRAQSLLSGGIMKKMRHDLSFSLYRWINILILTILGIFLSFLLIPFFFWLTKIVDSHLLSYSYYLIYLLYFLIAAVAVRLLIFLGGFRYKDVVSKISLLYPPTWFAGVLGAIIFGVILIFLGIKHFTVFYPDSLILSISFIIGVFCPTFCSFLYDFKKTRENFTMEYLNKSTDDKNDKLRLDWIYKEKPIKLPTEDIFHYSEIAKRIAFQLIDTPLKTVGIIGPYGCGKSSVLNMVDYYLNYPDKLLEGHDNLSFKDFSLKDRIIICRVGGWGLRNEAACELILNSSIKALSNHVDCLRITSLPNQYSLAIGSVGGFFSKMIEGLLVRINDPIYYIEQIDNILKTVNIRLILFLEDLDRNSQGDLFSRDILALMDRIRNQENLSFVLAIGSDLQDIEWLLRVVEHKESVPKLLPEYVVNYMGKLREILKSKYPNDFLFNFEERGQYYTTIEDYKQHKERIGLQFDVPYFDPVDAIPILLDNPRIFKNTVRRILVMWDRLHGEIDIDNLILLNILRDAAPEAFYFILENISALRSLDPERYTHSDHDTTDKRHDKLLHRFEEITNNVSWDVAAARYIIGYLFPGFGEKFRRFEKSLQGVWHKFPHDYWDRFIRERLNDGDIPDQTVIFTILQLIYEADSANYIASSLAESIFNDNEFANSFEHFGTILAKNDVRIVTEKLFFKILTFDHRVFHSADYPGFLNMNRLYRKFDVIEDSEDNLNWICKQIKVVLPLSLQLSNDIYRFWKLDLESDKRSFLRLLHIDIAKEKFHSTPDAIIKSLSNSGLWSLFHFVRLYSEPNYGGDGYSHTDWIWLAETLFGALRINPSVIAPPVLRLITSSAEERPLRYHLDKNFGKDFFKQYFSDVIDIISSIDATEIDTQDDIETTKQLIKEAKKILENKHSTPK
jgi:hypothetical protein